jgi:importin subunit beta-1
MEGPSTSTLKPLVVQAFPVFLELMNDPSVPVQDTTAWTIGRICDFVPEAIDPQQHLPNLIKVLVLGLSRDPRVASNCAWVTHSPPLIPIELYLSPFGPLFSR